MVADWAVLRRAAGGVRALLEVNALRGGHQMQLRNQFIARRDGGALPTAVVLLRRGGRDAPALRLCILLLWLAAPLSVRDPRVAPSIRASIDRLADATGLQGTVENRRRRVRTTLRTLASYGILTYSEAPRGWVDIVVRRDTAHASEDDFVRPGVAAAIHPSRERAYVTLRPAVLAEGWATAMSGRALVVLIAMRYLAQTLSSPERLFLSEQLRERRFGFSEEVYYRGTAELKAYGALVSDRAGVRSQTHAHRSRTTFRLNIDARTWYPPSSGSSLDDF